MSARGPAAPGASPTAHAAEPAPPARLIAFYLPQYHPIPENDAWWGPGFTEWHNVVRARPRFRGHYQPHLPADLGYYDLREPAVREAQAALARRYGIAAFCYWHYWFGGKRLLERPFADVLASGRPAFPFCLAWANEPWSRRWDGRPAAILQPQPYGGDPDDAAHIAWLLTAFRDPRYLRVDGRPLFLVYRPDRLPDAARTARLWRAAVARAGLPGLHLVGVESHFNPGWDPRPAGFDATVWFQPQFARALATLPPPGPAARLRRRLRLPAAPRYPDYARAWPRMDAAPPATWHRYYTVCPGWDNTARKGAAAFLLHRATPAAYARWLARAVARVQVDPPAQRLVFVNAWNEWAEGAHLEPDRRHGHAYPGSHPARAARGRRPEAPVSAAPPKISVILIAYNQAPYVATAVDSLLAQTRGDFELWLVDDASSDGTAAILARYSDRPRVRLRVNAANRGLQACLAQAMRDATGAYVVWTSGDDEHAPGLLARQAAVLDAYPRVALVYTNFYLLSPDGRTRTLPPPHDARPELAHDYLRAGSAEFAALLAGNHLVTTGAVMFRRAAYFAAGGIDPGLPEASDWDLWLRLCLTGDTAHIAVPLFGWRRHPQALSARMRDSGQFDLDALHVLEKALALRGAPAIPAARRRRLLGRARFAVARATLRPPGAPAPARIAPGAARRYLLRAVASDPGLLLHRSRARAACAVLLGPRARAAWRRLRPRGARRVV